MKLLATIALTLALLTSAFAKDKYPLTMSAIFTKGHSKLTKTSTTAATTTALTVTSTTLPFVTLRWNGHN